MPRPYTLESGRTDVDCRYTFHNQWMLRLALVHTSAFPVPGAPCSSGISLAWMGDAALNLIVSEQLMAAYCSASMGELSAARSRLVSREMCRRWGSASLPVSGRGRSMLISVCVVAQAGAYSITWRAGLREAVCICRRATELKLNDYLVVGPSILSNRAGMSDSMIAELFESVWLLCAAPMYIHRICTVMMSPLHHPQHSLISLTDK